MVSILKRRFLACVVVLLAVALLMPASVLAYNWTKTPVSPLVPGGVWSTKTFKHVVLNHKKVYTALKDIVRINNMPSWVYTSAIAETVAGDIHSANLPVGTRIGAMGFGPNKTTIVDNTVWRGSKKLPYYYVDAAKTVVEGEWNVTRTYRVCLAKPCGNPFVLGKTITRTRVAVPMYNLYIEKLNGRQQQIRQSGWHVVGTIGGVAVDAVTSSDGPVLVGSYPAGTAYSLHEVLQDGWDIVTPPKGEFIGTMQTQDLTLTFVNEQL